MTVLSIKAWIFSCLLLLPLVTAWPSGPVYGAALLRREDDNPAADASSGCGPYCTACKARLGCTTTAPESDPVDSKKRNLDFEPAWSAGITIDAGSAFDELDRNATFAHDLGKRTLAARPDKSGLADYLDARARSRGSLGVVRSRGGDDLSFARMARFSDYASRNLVISTGTGGFLTGCTVLAIISKRAIYMGHFWQNLGFQNLDTEDPEPANFQQNIANLISGQTPLFYASGDALDTSLFTGDGDVPYAAIMTPRNSDKDGGALYFPDQIGQLSALITKLIPGCTVRQYPYVAQNSYRAAWRGRALFEYDANADGAGNGDWRLFVEDKFAQGSALGQLVIPRAG